MDNPLECLSKRVLVWQHDGHVTQTQGLPLQTSTSGSPNLHCHVVVTTSGAVGQLPRIEPFPELPVGML